MGIVTYLTVSTRSVPLPDIQAAMYEYVVAANGVFVRGRRTGLCVTLPVIAFPASARLRGLVEVEPFFTMDYPRVPADQVRSILKMSLEAREDSCPVEALFTWRGMGNGKSTCRLRRVIWHPSGLKRPVRSTPDRSSRCIRITR